MRGRGGQVGDVSASDRGVLGNGNRKPLFGWRTCGAEGGDDPGARAFPPGAAEARDPTNEGVGNTDRLPIFLPVDHHQFDKGSTI